MAFTKLPPVEYLRQRLRLDAATGKLYWRERQPSDFRTNTKSPEHMCRTWNARFAGREAFTAYFNTGYRQGQIDKQTLLAHRVIWKMHTGDEPQVIDHLNGTKDDNRPENLCSGTYTDNARNRPMQVNNRSGCVGVSQYSGENSWVAELGRRYLGSFKSFDEAVLARKRAEAEAGFHPNHGR